MMPGPSKETHEISSLEAGNSIVILMCLCHICTNKVDYKRTDSFSSFFQSCISSSPDSCLLGHVVVLRR